MRTYLPNEVCAVAGCPPSTLRAWRNRNGLFADRAVVVGKWSRFTLADVIAVRTLVLLTSMGFEAQRAVDLVNAMDAEFERAAHGAGRRIGVARQLDSDALEFRPLDNADIVANQLGHFLDPITIVIDLHAIAWGIAAALTSGGGE